MPVSLFKVPNNVFLWRYIKTWLIRSQYNELLHYVLTEYKKQYATFIPSFRNPNNCLTIELCNDEGRCSSRFKGTILQQENTNPEEAAFLKAQVHHANLSDEYAIAQRSFDFESSPENTKKLQSAKAALQSAKKELDKNKQASRSAATNSCFDIELDYFCLPGFIYNRLKSLPDVLPIAVNLDFSTTGLTVGALVWLYYYEKMGIFKILGALLDDYNYKGKYTIAGSRSDKNGTPNEYSELMDMISTLHRLGISSNLRDRICTYQRVLGVTIENNLGIETEKNTGFMDTFNKLIDNMLEYYKTKQLAQAIQAQSTTSPIQPRSSVATQTSIRDTINVLKQHFEPMEYGRNQINTFLGIAMVHATICLLNKLKTEIGIPNQYEKPEEFIPAAYDILVGKRAVTLTETNRFIVYDNCASYGYRLLTDLETIEINELNLIATGSNLDTWLNDIEGWVEGYKNASQNMPEGLESIV